MKKTVEVTEKKTVYEKSFFMHLIYIATSWFYTLAANGFFGKIFTGYSKLEDSFERSRIYKKLNDAAVFKRLGVKLKRSIAKAFEDSRIITAVSYLLSRTLKCPLKFYGAAFTVTGAVGLLVYTLEGGSFYVFFREPTEIFACVAFVAVGLYFLTSGKRLSETLYESHIMSGLLFEGFGIQKDFFSFEENNYKGYLVPVLFGLVFGSLTYFVSPAYYVTGLLVMIAAAMIIAFPELGVLALLAMIPVANYLPHATVAMISVVVITEISYLVKLIRGKRLARFRMVDIAVMAFIAIRLLSGVFSAGGFDALAQAAAGCCLMTAYLLGVTLIRNKEWLKRATVTFVLFGALSLIIGVFQMFDGSFESGWLDSSAFEGIRVRITSTFENPNNFAAYLLLLIPFALCKLLECKKNKGIVFYSLTVLLAVVCMVQTWSRGAWLGLCVSLTVFFLVYSCKSFPYVVAGGAVTVLGVSFLAPTISGRFLSIGNMADSSISYRFSAWKGVVQMLNSYGWISGIGYGEASFAALYPAFAYSGASAVRHAHSLYLQLLTESGIPGLVMFVIVVVLFGQNCFEYLYRIKNSEARAVTVAGVAALVGFLVMGITDYVWYNSSVHLAFWMVLAMVNANIRISFAEQNRLGSELMSSYSVNLEIDPESLY